MEKVWSFGKPRAVSSPVLYGEIHQSFTDFCAKNHYLANPHLRKIVNLSITSYVYLSFWVEVKDTLTPYQHLFHHCEKSQGV